MNIGIFTNNYLPNPYGVTGSIESFREEFEKRGHRVYIFAPRYKNYVDKNPNVFRYPSWDIEFKIKFPLAIPYSWKISKIIKNLNLDVIHSQHPNLLGTAAKKWARRLARRRGGKKIPLIFTWHTLYDQYAHFAKFIPSKIAAGYIIRKAARYANSADAVIVPTDSIIEILKNWGVENKIIPIATGVVERDFQNADRNIIRQKYAIADDEILLLLISRLTSEKNAEFVAKSVLEAMKKNSKIKFLVSGGGDQAEIIKKLFSEERMEKRFIFSNVVGRGDLKNYYAAADIFVYGSKSETQGMVISEAMYCGLPIVAVNATGIKSLVLNNGNGFLVDESVEEFVKAIEKLADDEALRQKFGETSARIARMKFTSSICAEKMLEVYKKSIEV